MSDQEIAQRLKAARIAAGYKTAREAADALNVGYSGYVHHENGTRSMVGEAAKYAEALNVSTDWLLLGRGQGPRQETMAERLKMARIAAGYATAREAAKALDISYSTYAGHESGTRGAKSEVETYAKAFGVTVGWLIAGEGETPAVNAGPDWRQMISQAVYHAGASGAPQEAIYEALVAAMPARQRRRIEVIEQALTELGVLNPVDPADDGTG